ncbi:hypothetical protein [Halobacillus massiliensis]|uniref:hypothetical protein n=1 Tax=Halobacillus massiliensis TaxID=1926286 RepID=UPI0015C48049|nr:hypothetical protein [Halobacillus massiliensis]
MNRNHKTNNQQRKKAATVRTYQSNSNNQSNDHGVRSPQGYDFYPSKWNHPPKPLGHQG